MTTELIALQKALDDLAHKLDGDERETVRQARQRVGQLFELKAKLRGLGE